MANLFSATTTTTTTRGTMNNTLTKPHILLLSRNSPKIPSFVSSSRIPFPILFSAPKTRSSLRPSAGSAPPPPPRRQPDPPPQKGLLRFEGLSGTLSKIQDRTRIFFAVLFWLSLFFWASAWDGRNKGRSDKGSRNRK